VDVWETVVLTWGRVDVVELEDVDEVVVLLVDVVVVVIGVVVVAIWFGLGGSR